MIERIISGGQTGADIAALRAAKMNGIPTGGWMPDGFRALDGDHPEYAELYGMKTTASRGYPERTSLNVQDSDGTLRIAWNFNSPGERATIREVKRFDKPCFDFQPNAHLAVIVSTFYEHAAQAVAWINVNDIRVLNVAGNAQGQVKLGASDEFCDMETLAYRFVALVITLDKDHARMQDATHAT